MRIVIAQDGLSLRGADHVGAGWARELAAAGHDVTILCLDGDGQGPARVKCGSAVRIEVGRGITAETARMTMHRPAIQAHDVVAVNSCPAALPLLPVFQEHGKRLVLVLHGVGPWSQQFLVPRLLPLWSRVVVVAPHEAPQAVAAGADPSRVVVVRTCPELRAVTPRDVARANLGLSPRAFVFGYAGRACQAKGVPYLVVSLRHLVETGVDGRLLLAGMEQDGQGEAAESWRINAEGIKRLAEDLKVADRVRWLPATEDLADFYGVLDAACLVSNYEGSPLFVREALAAGVPVVATDVGDVREVATRETGSVVVPPPAATDGVDERLAVAVTLALATVAVRDDATREGFRSAAMTRSSKWTNVEAWRAKELPALVAALSDDVEPVGPRHRIVVVADVRGWAYDNVARAVQRYCSDRDDVEIVYARDWWDAAGDPPQAMRESFADADLVLWLHAYMHATLRENCGTQTRHVVAFYDRATVEGPHAETAATHAHVLLGANRRYVKRLRERFPRADVRPCEDGVDTDLFSRSSAPRPQNPSLRVGWVGNSAHRAADGSDLKGLDTILRPAVAAVNERGKAAGAPHDLVELVVLDVATCPAVRHDEMPEFYRGIDVIACASANEGTPNPVLEAAACGVPFLSTDVGVVPDFFGAEFGFHGGFIIEPRSVEAFADGIQCFVNNRDLLTEEMGTEARRRAETWSWEIKARQFCDAFRDVLRPHADRTDSPKVDLSDVATVFLVTVGSPVCADARAALAAQDCRFKLDVIENVAPMDRAFQAMIDRCTTPFFVQVDEDMILHPAAVRTLIERLRSEPPDVFMHVAPLWDVHAEAAIFGCKAYRTEAMRQAGYEPGDSCEIGQMEKAKALGYRWTFVWPITRELSIGLHGTRYTPEEAFSRYWRLAQKQARHAHSIWTRSLPSLFSGRLLRAPTEEDLFALLGYVCGTIEPLGPSVEEDFRQRRESFGRVASMQRSVEGPRYINMYVTYRCNAACRWCARGSEGVPGLETPELNPCGLRQALDAFPTVRSACIAGFGEPLMSNEIPGLVEECKRRGIAINLITNGRLLAERIAWGWLAGVDEVSVSLNASTTDEHLAETCVPGGFEAAVEGVKAAVALRRSTGKPVVAVTRVLTQRTVGAAEAFLDLAASLNVDRVDLLNLLPHGVTSDEQEVAFWQDVLHDGMPQAARAALAALRYHRAAGLVRSWPVMISRERNPRRCSSPWVSVGVDGQGLLSPCQRMSGPACWSVRASQYSAWLSDEFTDLREQICGARPMRRECRLCFGNWSG